MARRHGGKLVSSGAGRVVALALALLLGTAAVAAQEPEQRYQLYLQLQINQMPTQRIIPVTVQGGRYFADADELRSVGVRLAHGASGLQALDAIAGLGSRYDQEQQRLDLTLPSEWLPHQQLGQTSVYDMTPAQSDLGLLFNYDFFYNNSEDAAQFLSGFLEQRAFGGFGVLDNTGVYRHTFDDLEENDDGYRRFDSFWRYNDQPRMTSYQAGDLVTGALTWNSAVRLGGVQVARNFGLRPDLVTYPLPRFNGDAQVPTSVDLFINNARVSSDQIAPGPFTLSNVPFISGAGTATLVTTDALGRQVATTVPFYVTNSLLQQGLYDYSLSLGQLREDYGLKNFSYGSRAASGTFRYGVSDAFTLESHAELGEDLRLGGLGGTFAVGRWGTLGSSYTSSHYGGERGQQYSLGYSYFSPLFGVGLQRLQRSTGYVDLGRVGALEDGVLGGALARRIDQATFSVNPPQLGSFGVGYFASESMDGERTRLVNLSWSRSLWGNSSLYLAFNREIGGDGYSALAQFILPFDLYSTFSASIERDSQGDYRQRVNYGRAPPSDGGVGYNLAYGIGNGHYRQADVTWRNRFNQLQAGAYEDDGRRTVWGDMSGSVVAMDGSLFAANRINDAFVLVSTDGFADVPVSFENQPIGRTDRDGHLLVPWVPSYYRGRYEVDPLELPANVRVPEVIRNVAVHQGSGALLEFGMRRVVAASILLVDSRGEVVPRGSKAELVGQGTTAYVGWDGLVYFEGLGERNRIRVERPDGGRCELSFELKDPGGELAQVGPLTCR
ncbi:fimbria/pilus outer membrane usher protein [Metapseudomonas resinovorans]|uniref:Putative type 1 pili usher protein n=1 Tax=Metapseudomonas resinovorans NBRC 106553 TaxID=1245471 RepID=S6BC33_METRE|nr:fimbria/pilus outer membrane usher protein [Pseudomonas resinovorans]BAN46599.1 putative type 1 pili usher protein [Pseudomonas resinovorans NBRC 106553]